MLFAGESGGVVSFTEEGGAPLRLMGPRSE